MKTFKICVFALLVALIPAKIFAWGVVGHRLVAKIAESQLKPAVKDSLAYYLDKTSLDDVANWMDEIRSNHEYDYLATWHYVDWEKGTAYNHDSMYNAIWAIDTMIKELKNRSGLTKERIAFDIKVLVHLIGDIHQPLHCGYPGDKGGNLVMVYFGGAASNLHRVWDTQIIEESVVNQPVTWADTKQFSKTEWSDVKKIDVEHWANESRAWLPQAYDFPDESINAKYIDKNKPVVERQLLIGGVRLATVLNRIWGG